MNNYSKPKRRNDKKLQENLDQTATLFASNASGTDYKGPIAFRSVLGKLTEYINSISDQLPCDTILPVVRQAQRLLDNNATDDSPGPNENGDGFSDMSALDGDAAQPFYDAAQSIQALRENPEQLDSLRRAMEESFQLATRRRSRIDTCKPYGR